MVAITTTPEDLARLGPFNDLMRKLVHVPKAVIQEREQKWQAAKKKAAKKR